jgi:hypothetical protein
MRSYFVLSLMASLLVFGAGCGASRAPSAGAKSPSASETAIEMNDSDVLEANWAPPGELDFKVAEAREDKRSKRASAQSMAQPNRREVTRGQVHAASY